VARLGAVAMLHSDLCTRPAESQRDLVRIGQKQGSISAALFLFQKKGGPPAIEWRCSFLYQCA